MDDVTITMEHTEETVRRLSRVQYDTFSARTKVMWYIVCLVCLALGMGVVGRLGQGPRLALIAFGAIALMNVGASAKARAGRILASVRQKGVFPRTTLTFKADEIGIQERSGLTDSLPYSGILRLIRDDEYWYLFISRTAAYMLPMAGLGGQISPARFEALLQQKTGLEFARPFNLLRVNLADILAGLRRRKKL